MYVNPQTRMKAFSPRRLWFALIWGLVFMAVTIFAINVIRMAPVASQPRAPTTTLEMPKPPVQVRRPVSLEMPLRGQQAKQLIASQFKNNSVPRAAIYAFEIEHKNPNNQFWPYDSYFVLNSSDAANVTVYQVKTSDGIYAYEPQLSPNQEYVLFKVGNPMTTNGFGLYVANLKSLQVQEVNITEMAYDSVYTTYYAKFYWSPNSRYFSYVRRWQKNRVEFSVARLHIFDVQTGRDRSLIRNDGCVNNESWTPQNTLLFSAYDFIGNARILQEQSHNKNEIGHSQRPVGLHIYECVPASGAAKLLIKDANHPLASPDGKRIAFVGPRQPINGPGRIWWEEEPVSKLYVLVSNRDGKGRHVVGRGENITALYWRADSQRLLVEQTTYWPKLDDPNAYYPETNVYKGRVIRRLTEYNVLTGKKRTLDPKTFDPEKAAEDK